MRRFLGGVTAILALVGIGFASYPFFSSLGPSEKVMASNPLLVVDVSKISEGEAKVFEWNGLPVIVLHRSESQLKQLNELEKYRDHDGLLTSVPDPDPEGLILKYRSIKPQYFVVYGWTGNAIQCSSLYTPELYNYPMINGGFEEMCRGAWHDITGRLMKGSWPQGGDLPIPPYEFIDDTTIKVGPENEHVLRQWRSEKQTHNTSLQPTSGRVAALLG
jgi:ubiquinol-cytochrome c reductase iron-sulfur subunit